MIKAYILIDVRKGFTERVVEELGKIDEIELLSVVTGEHDIIIRVSVDVLDNLFHLMVNQIDPIQGIVETVTAIETLSVTKE